MTTVSWKPSQEHKHQSGFNPPQQSSNMIDHDYNTVTAMEASGGEFVNRLAAAYIAADDDNRAIIRTAFRSIWSRYAAMGNKEGA